MALVAALALVLSGCGSDGPSTSINATMREFEFSPTEWTVAAGETITVELTNDGSVDHEWVILRPGVRITSEADLPDTEEELLANFVYWEDEVGVGETKTVTFTAPAAGTYQIICAIETHFNAGMEGELTSS
jgi:plastocyanin